MMRRSCSMEANTTSMLWMPAALKYSVRFRCDAKVLLGRIDGQKKRPFIDDSHFQVSTAACARSGSDKRSPSFAGTTAPAGCPPGTAGRSTTRESWRRPTGPGIELLLMILLNLLAV